LNERVKYLQTNQEEKILYIYIFYLIKKKDIKRVL
jgi:hypothetical protein